MATVRARGLGLEFPGTPGRWNALTDVPGVRVGFETIRQDDGGSGIPVRTGVTAILPVDPEAPLRPIWAGVSRFNGNGEMTGTHWIQDGGCFLGPVLVTNTHAVGMAHHAAVHWMLERYPRAFWPTHRWLMPVVAETYDGALNDINGQHVTAEHVWRALNTAASGPVAEGGIGGGAGMVAFGFQAGTGTASRVVTVAGQAWVLGGLVQANHGARRSLAIRGVPIGQLWEEEPLDPGERGSLIVVLGTDLPLLPAQLERVARRAAIGMARTGAYGGHNSGDLFLAFSVANARPLEQAEPDIVSWEAVRDDVIDGVYEAAAEVVEEAVVNALVAGRPAPLARIPGAVVPALDGERLKILMERWAARRPDGAERRTPG